MIRKMMIQFLFSWSLLATLVDATQRQTQDCVATADTTQDFFPVKVAPVHSKHWNISYHDTYKIVTNTADQDSYLLYQVGTCPPVAELEARNFSSIIQIPVTNVGITLTNSITYLEQLRVLDLITVFLSEPSYISSPCFMDAINADQVSVVSDFNPETGFDPTQDRSGLVEKTVAFKGSYQTIPFDQTVNLATYRELTNAAIFEWIKFYAAFFNLEETANTIMKAAEDRFQCVATNAAEFQTDATKPVVLWAYYSSYCGAWDVGTCTNGNYYCEFAETCSAELLGSDEGSVEACSATYMTVEEVVALGKDADHWVFPATNWNATYVEFKEQLDTMKSVRDKQVFDFQGSGGNAWFEQRYAEYYDVAQDFCAVVGTTRSLIGPNWFRNVFTEEVGEYEDCDEARPLILSSLSDDCEVLTPLAPDNETEESAASLQSVAATLFAALMGVMLL